MVRLTATITPLYVLLRSDWRLRLQGQADGNRGAIAKLTFDQDCAPVIFDQAPRDRQTQTDAVRSGGIEWLKNALQRVLRNTHAGIADDEFQPCLLFSRLL